MILISILGDWNSNLNQLNIDSVDINKFSEKF